MHFEDHTRTEVIGGEDALGVIDPGGWLRCRVSFDGVEPGRGDEQASAVLLVERFEDGEDDEPNYDQWPATVHRALAGEAFTVELASLGATLRVSLSPDPLEEHAAGVEVHGVAPEDWQWRVVPREQPPDELGG